MHFFGSKRVICIELRTPTSCHLLYGYKKCNALARRDDEWNDNDYDY